MRHFVSGSTKFCLLFWVVRSKWLFQVRSFLLQDSFYSKIFVAFQVAFTPRSLIFFKLDKSQFASERFLFLSRSFSSAHVSKGNISFSVAHVSRTVLPVCISSWVLLTVKIFRSSAKIKLSLNFRALCKSRLWTYKTGAGREYSLLEHHLGRSILWSW